MSAPITKYCIDCKKPTTWWVYVIGKVSKIVCSVCGREE